MSETWAEAAHEAAERARKAQQAINELGAGPPQPEQDPRPTVRLAPDVHRELLTIQYQRRMAGEKLTLSDIIAERFGLAVKP